MKRKFLKNIGVVIITIITILPSYHIFYLNKHKKKLKINILNVENLNSNLSKIKLNLMNTGNEPIRKSDFFTELTFNTDSIEILDIKINEVTPDNLNIKFFKTYKNQIRLDPTLLNKNDELVFEILTNGKIENLFIDGRINGIDKIDLDCENHIEKEIKLQLQNLEQFRNLNIIRATFGYQDSILTHFAAIGS